MKIAALHRKHLNESPRGEQAALVRLWGVNKSTMSRWLDGTLHPNGPNTMTIVEYLRAKKQQNQ